MSGLSDAELDALIADGTLVREQHQRRRHVTRSSLFRYLVEHTPERFLVVGSPGTRDHLSRPTPTSVA
jgi:hypothetical protein